MNNSALIYIHYEETISTSSIRSECQYFTFEQLGPDLYIMKKPLVLLNNSALIYIHYEETISTSSIRSECQYFEFS